MITLTTPVSVANAIPSLRRWQVVDVRDYARSVVPNLKVTVQVLGAGGVPYNEYQLYAYDGQASQVLANNPAPQSTQDQLQLVARSLSGTPYTTLAALWNGNTAGATRAARLRSMETAILAAGLVDAELAGT